MNRGQRIDTIRECADALATREWSEIDLVLRAFDLPTSNDWWDGDPRSYVIAMVEQATDSVLVELRDYLVGGAVDAPHLEGGPWPAGYFRLFISHLADHKKFATDLKNAVADYGIHGFVAHEDIHPSKDWQAVIEVGLGTCDGLVALLHPGFRDSAWCDQEVGYALGRRVKVVPVNVEGVNPYGLMGKFQAVYGVGLSPTQLAGKVFEALMTEQRHRNRLSDGLIQALAESFSFDQATRRAVLTSAHVRDWTSERLDALQMAFNANNQIHGSFKARPVVERILRQRQPTADDVPF